MANIFFSKNILQDRSYSDDSQNYGGKSNTDKDNNGADDNKDAYKHGYNAQFDTSTAYVSSYHNSLADVHKAPLVSNENKGNGE